MASSAIKLAVIGGDGIGPEVVAEALKVLQAAHTDRWLTATEDAGGSDNQEALQQPVVFQVL